MKKFTLLIAMFICAIGFSQQETSATYSEERSASPAQEASHQNIFGSAILGDDNKYHSMITNWVEAPITRSSAAIETLTTTFAGGNGNFGNMFDINALTDVTLLSFDVNAQNGVTIDVEVYAKSGTWVGFEGNAAAWTLIGTATSVVSNGEGIATPLNLTLGYAMLTGETHAFYVTPTDPGGAGGFQYTNGTTTGAVFASDTNIEFLEGSGVGYPFDGGTVFQPRVFNGNIIYDTLGGGGGGACANALLEVNQDVEDTCMAFTTQGGIAQSYIALEPMSAGAGIKFTSASVGDNVNLSLWDGLPNAGGTMLATGATLTANDVWVDVFWDPVVNVTMGNTYYIVIEGDASLPCIAGSTNDPYAGGNVFANPNYDPFPGFDYTFRTYSCDNGGATCTNATYVSTEVPFDIDGAGTSTADCVNAPNLVSVTVSSVGTIGVDADIDNVALDITHTFDGDLTISLVSPSGVELILTDGNGGSGDNYTGTVFQDGGADITADAAPFTGTFEPEGGTFAAAFAGESITGDWNLKVCDGAGGDSGTIDNFTLTICEPAVVDNDLCIDAIAMSCGDTATGDTSDNTDTGGNPATDEWYSFTGTGTPEFVTFSLCDGGTSYDSLLRVFDACGGTEIAVNDDFCGLQSELTFTSDGTSTYYIMIEGFGSSAGVYSLEVTCMLIPPPPANDECTGAIAVDCGDSVTGTTIDATIDTGVAVDCGAATITSPGVWYTFTDVSGLVSDITLTMCSGNGTADFDTKMSVFTGDCGAPPLTCVDGNDDTCGLLSEVSFQSDGVSTYYILVHSFGGATGNFTFDVNCTPVPPPNDDIANSITITDCPFTDPGVAMPAATLESGNPAGCNIDGATGVWYNITPAGDGTITATIVSPSGLSHVTFYTAADENASEVDLTLVDQIDNQCLPGTTTTIDVVTDQVYYVFVVNTGGITDISFDCDLLAISDNVIEGFSFYPNPSNDVININSQDLIENVSIYNILGQKVVDQNIDATSSQINVANLAQGTYIMKATVNGVTASYKVIKK